ncbi:sporulation membrane protein YtaF [Aminipila butyrica]|uniref:Sporulation membrane protein YtaF n=1 Tax=Aminipila butyrica TaxID=433296 RepID=A0A858BU94_9FIRM|nr:sporulation membrane protein YtaF [Aminipila butyrica]QIB69513.1 sporulation membrane protein YtaF [Aminipila butyrica]
MTWLFILGFALSSSLDNLGVGITYGIRKIRISVFSNTIISIICFLFSFLGILFGKWVSTVIPGILPVLLSVILLSAIGLRIIWLSLSHKQQAEEKEVCEIKGLSSILKNPECADFDKSKDIGIIEALVLGVALSTNALTNGLSAGLLGYTPMAISLTAAIGSFLMVQLGIKAGQKVADIQIGPFQLGQFGTLISGILILLIAIRSFI